MDLTYESGDSNNDIEFDYETGDFVEVIYSTPQAEPLSLRKKSTHFPYASVFIK